MRKQYLVVTAALLTACTGVQGETYLGRPGSPAWFATASPDTIADYFVRRCQTYGFQLGTPEMAQCVQQEAGAARGLAGARMSGVLARMSGPTQVQCTTVRQGAFLNTICN